MTVDRICEIAGEVTVSGQPSAEDLLELRRSANAINSRLLSGIGNQPQPGGQSSFSDCQTFITPQQPASISESPEPNSDFKTIGKYEIRRRLGHGGMGVVYLAFDPLIEREVALKVLSPEISGTPAAPRRFLGEARSIGRLNHPHVVSIYEIGESNEVYFLVMELLDGGNVAELVEKNGPLPWPEACRITVEAARGLAAAHAAGMIHRDVKPANLMLTRSSVVKVVDFGLSKLLDSDHSIAEAVTRAGQILGTPQYMSPEQFDGGTVDLRTDIYALGATLFWLLTKNFPYQECTSLVQLMKAHVMKPVPLVSHRTPGLPIELDRIIGRAMAKDPQDRYTTCDEMANDLESLTEQRRRQPPSIIPTVSVQTRMLSDRQISSALVVEPSRLQAMMRRDILIQSGADTVEICSSGAEALTITETRPPDLIWTAMELPDGRGTSWLKSANVGNRLRLSTVVVNSSDCTLSELLSVSRTGCLILAPKSENLESILRVIHGSGPIRLKRGPFSSATDFAETQVRLIPDTSQPPESLLRFLSDLRIDDPDVVLPSRSGTNRGLTPDLTLLVRTAETLPGDEAIYSAMVTRRRSGLTAAVQSFRDRLTLRAVSLSGVTAITGRPLTISNLRNILEAGYQLENQNQSSLK